MQPRWRLSRRAQLQRHVSQLCRLRLMAASKDLICSRLKERRNFDFKTHCHWVLAKQGLLCNSWHSNACCKLRLGVGVSSATLDPSMSIYTVSRRKEMYLLGSVAAWILL